MTPGSTSVPPLLRASRPSAGAFRALQVFFRIAALTFLLLSFSFEVNDAGTIWIMWRDAPALAGTFTALAVAMAIAAYFINRRIRGSAESPGELFAAPKGKPGNNPYDIWRTMALRSRVNLALAVFLIFASIGPIITLMEISVEPVRPLHVIILTVASGAISASIILLGNRKLLMVAAVVILMGALQNAGFLTDTIQGRQPGHAPLFPTKDTILSPERVTGMRAQRSLIGAAAVLLVAGGYVVFIVLLVGEGRHRVRLEAEIAIASRIQQTLLPPTALTGSWFEVGGLTVPATEVGGDYFDYLLLPDGRLAVIMADVAGHGVGAGILAAMTKSAFRSQITHDPEPAPMLRHLNRTLVQLVERNMFVTMAYVLIDHRTERASIATAGHPAVLHLRHDVHDWEEVRTPSLALGMNRLSVFEQREVPVSAGDRFVLYTDGVSEAVSPHGEQFGLRRLGTVALQAGSRPAVDLAGDIIGAVKTFMGSRQAADDATVVTVLRTDRHS